ncbi:MAG: hypothetical protein D3924_14580 [Candidatus Electrothrix sp. AR4]|nr:hypothetical protein [Candidatus Electrothrix sp. AR4]
MLNNVIREEGFQSCDGLVLAKPLLLEARELLPVPASTGFWFHEPVCQKAHGFSQRQVKILADCQSDKVEGTGITPVVLQGMLVLPLLAGEGGGLDLVIYDVDTSMLRKMDPEWLLELRVRILRRFSRIRHIYTDPSTGLYNQRAFDLLLSDASCWKSFFLVATVSGTRTIAGGFQKTRQLSTRLKSLSSEPLFYFGQGLFCFSPSR